MLHVSYKIKIVYVLLEVWGYAVAQLVDALRYKADYCGFDSRGGHWDFSFT
jgi:hypothetical protein